MNLRKLIIAVYLLLFIGIGAASAGFFWQTRREYQQLSRQESLRKMRLAELRSKLAEQERVLQRLRDDPAYVEREIRRRLRYAKPDDLIFRFDD